MDSSSSTDNNNGKMGGGVHRKQAAENPLCARGCGFFGTAEKGGLCSKCYSDELKQKMAKSESAILGKRDHQQQHKIDNNNPLEHDIAKLIDSMKATTIPEINGDKPSASAAPIAKNRCECCRKKVGLLGFQCRCGGTFCGVHRYPESHTCRIDFKEAGKIAIAKENPVCKADKISDRV